MNANAPCENVDMLNVDAVNPFRGRTSRQPSNAAAQGNDQRFAQKRNHHVASHKPQGAHGGNFRGTRADTAAYMVLSAANTAPMAMIKATRSRRPLMNIVNRFRLIFIIDGFPLHGYVMRGSAASAA